MVAELIVLSKKEIHSFCNTVSMAKEYIYQPKLSGLHTRTWPFSRHMLPFLQSQRLVFFLQKFNFHLATFSQSLNYKFHRQFMKWRHNPMWSFSLINNGKSKKKKRESSSGPSKIIYKSLLKCLWTCFSVVPSLSKNKVIGVWHIIKMMYRCTWICSPNLRAFESLYKFMDS